MRSRVSALTRPGLFSARDTVDAATLVSLAMSLMVTGRVRPGSGALAMGIGNHAWQQLANGCHVCQAGVASPAHPPRWEYVYGHYPPPDVRGRRDPARGDLGC